MDPAVVAKLLIGVSAGLFKRMQVDFEFWVRDLQWPGTLGGDWARASLCQRGGTLRPATSLLSPSKDDSNLGFPRLAI